MVFLCLLLLIVFGITAFFLYRKSNSVKNITKRCIIAILAMVVLSVGLEISVFNINFYADHKNQPIDLNHYLSDRMDKNGNYTILPGSEIEFPEIGADIDNIKIIPADEAPDSIDVTIQLTDEANKYYFSTPKRTVYKDIEESHSINISTAGVSQHLRLLFHGKNQIIKLRSITLNERENFNFNFVRVAILSAILLLLYIFRPTSSLYEMKLSESHATKNSLVIGFCTLLCIVFIIIGTLNPAFLGYANTDEGLKLVPLGFEHHNQYDELAQAIMQGKVYIDNDDIPQSLLDMENPYDNYARGYTANQTGDKYRWDVAFFNGHYYVYFGIVPLLLMYLPCRAILNAPFPSALGIILFAFIFAVGVFMLLGEIAEKKFKYLSVGTYILTSLAFIFCCGTMFLVKRPDFYSVPIICAMAFIVWGIFFWLKGRDSTKQQTLFLLLGSLCCALAVGCRPQSVLMCTVALPIFGEYFFKDKFILSPKGIKNLITLAIPFVIVASGIMYYNYIRFNSPFDFGSGYNLTTNDVTRRGFDAGRTGLGIFTYLFQTPKFTAVFPYLQKTSVETNYIGKTITENCFGGLITCTPVLWFIFAIGKTAKRLKQTKLLGITTTCLLIGLATVIANTQAGGLLQRYFSDFGYIFFLAAALVIFALQEKPNNGESNKNLTSMLFISTIFSVVYTLCLVFSVSDVTIDVQSPTAFGYIRHLVEFWL
ncbi:MAG: hypothetical protein IIX14_04600 [Clostridia bacterium]|nr:hypothetical protein [Clostridia bacterium]